MCIVHSQTVLAHGLRLSFVSIFFKDHTSRTKKAETVTQNNRRDILSARFILRKWAKQGVKYKENRRKFTLCKACIFKSITSIFYEFGIIGKLVKSPVTLCKNLNFLKSRQDVPFVVLGHILPKILNYGLRRKGCI